MGVSFDAQGLLPSAQQRAKRLRALAEDCRSMARIIQYRPDQESMLEMALQHDAEADQIETVAISEK
jgi:S-adenosylmethionine synthetase